ncbi:MAG: hypothetical protein L0241_13700, partial [Planctomycetia bacterium]|nr:hypothetical protein [Planctomycetia bacterium]
METLDLLKTIFGAIGGAFTVIGGLYGFIRWLRRKPEEDNSEENTQPGQRGRRGRPTHATHASMWPWILVGVVVLMWCSFGGLVLLGMLMSTADHDPYPPPPPPLDLSGVWVEEADGSLVSVTQQGNSVTMRFHILEQMGFHTTQATLTGTVQPSTDSRY